MSNSVVPAAAVARAKQLVRNKKLIKRTEDQKPAQDEREDDHKDPDSANAVQTGQGDNAPATMSDTTMSGDFSFVGALADAADSSASLTAEVAQDDAGGMSDDDDAGVGGTVLLVGAVGLVGAGIYVLADGGGGDSNDPPAFSADTQAVTTKEDTPVTATVTATDPDGDPLSYSVTTQPTKGTVTIGASDGKFTFTPSADFSGKDSFVVTVNDGQGGTDTITVNVTVDPVNDPPRADKANTSTVTTAEDTPVEIVVSFTDPEGNTPLVGPTVTDAPDKGTFALVGGKNIYTPGANFNGTDSITYTVTDSLGAVTTQTVQITVTPVNDAPTAAATQTVSTEAETAVTGTVAATDVDIATNGDVLTFTVSDKADNGTATIGADGKFTYTPNADFSGTDTFVVTVADKAGATVTQTVTVNVGPQVNEISIDVTGETTTAPAVIEATDGLDVFTDTANGGTKNDTDVIITGFEEGDIIAVTGATKAEYNFGSGETSVTNDPNDLYITFVDETGTSNLILIDDVLPDGSVVLSYETAVAAIGFDFMTFA